MYLSIQCTFIISIIIHRISEFLSTIKLPSLSQSSSHSIQYSVYGNDIDRKVLQAAEKNFELLYQSTNPIPYSLTNMSFHEYKNCITKECKEKLVILSNVKGRFVVLSLASLWSSFEES